MSSEALFCHISSAKIAELISEAKGVICYVAPGIQADAATAMVRVANDRGKELLIVCLDFDERVMRMGYGSIQAVEMLRQAGIRVSSSQGLRSGLIIVDDKGYSFTPTPLYLEGESESGYVHNALRLLPEQMKEALARFSPAAKAVAIAQAESSEERQWLENLPLEVSQNQVDEDAFQKVSSELEAAPPVKFDLVRQVRVYESYLQYADIKLTGAAIQRHRIAIPKSLQTLGGSEDLEGRLRTTFDLVEKRGELSSKPLEDELKEIRKITPSLGKTHGRACLKANKPFLEKRIDTLRDKLQAHQEKVEDQLQHYLDNSRKAIVDYYLQRTLDSPSDDLIGQMTTGTVTEEMARKWLNMELDRVIPKAESLISDMKLEVTYKDITYETLMSDDFLGLIKQAFPLVNWDRAHEEFQAAGEAGVQK